MKRRYDPRWWCTRCHKRTIHALSVSETDETEAFLICSKCGMRHPSSTRYKLTIACDWYKDVKDGEPT